MPLSNQPFKFPRDKDRYHLLEAIGSAQGATVYATKCMMRDTEVLVGIKILDLDKVEGILKLTQEIHLSETCSHESMIKVFCSFKVEKNQLWIVTSNSGFFSLRSIVQSSGLPESALAYVLREILRALDWIHRGNNLHKNIASDCIFLGVKSEVKLAFSSLTYSPNSMPNPSSQRPSWMMAPELMKNLDMEWSKEVDVWMFALLALELHYGQVPASSFGEFKSLVDGIEQDLSRPSKKPGSKGKIGKNSFLGKLGFLCFRQHVKEISEPLGEVLAACLAQEPEKRPTTSQLLECRFFRDCCSSRGQESLRKLVTKATLESQPLPTLSSFHVSKGY